LPAGQPIPGQLEIYIQIY